MFKEFKLFAMRGNVMDLAVGVIIGAAFGKVVASLVEDIIMPPIGRLLGHVDFSQSFCQPERNALRHIGVGESGGGPDGKLRIVSEYHY